MLSCQQQIQGRRIWWTEFGFHAVDGVHEISCSLGKVLRGIGIGEVWHFIVLHLNVKFPFFLTIQSNEHKLIRFTTSFNRPQYTMIVYLFSSSCGDAALLTPNKPEQTVQVSHLLHLKWLHVKCPHSADFALEAVVCPAGLASHPIKLWFDRVFNMAVFPGFVSVFCLSGFCQLFLV